MAGYVFVRAEEYLTARRATERITVLKVPVAEPTSAPGGLPDGLNPGGCCRSEDLVIPARC